MKKNIKISIDSYKHRRIIYESTVRTWYRERFCRKKSSWKASDKEWGILKVFFNVLHEEFGILLRYETHCSMLKRINNFLGYKDEKRN